MGSLKEDKFSKTRFAELRNSLARLKYGTNIKKHNKESIFLVSKTVDFKFKKKTITVAIILDSQFKRERLEMQIKLLTELWKERQQEYKELEKKETKAKPRT